jgi:heme A synthase
MLMALVIGRRWRRLTTEPDHPDRASNIRPDIAPRRLRAILSLMTRRGLALWAGAMAILGWVMMTVGALVRATQSGLGCPDWPTCHGKLIAGGGHALVEELHRWIATTLVVGLIGLAVIVLRRYRRERAVTTPMILVLMLLVVQVVMGGITVLLKNIAWTVVAHYGFAALLVASIAMLAVRLAYPGALPLQRDRFVALVSWFTVLTFGLLLAGSTLANAGSDSACGSGYPLCNGALLPSLDHNVTIALIHRLYAGAMLLSAVLVFVRSRRDRAAALPIRRAAALVMLLFLIQAAAGAVIVSVVDSTASEVVHSSLGSLTWLAVATLLALTRTLPAGAPAFNRTELATAPVAQLSAPPVASR